MRGFAGAKTGAEASGLLSNAESEDGGQAPDALTSGTVPFILLVSGFEREPLSRGASCSQHGASAFSRAIV